jgi:nucleotide-binding universal stress UspA family protein
MMILIAYDGSEDAKAAIQHAGKLMPGSPATVLTIWEPFDTMLARTPEVLRPLARVREAEEIDREEVAAAEASMNEGVKLADAAGLDATPLTARLNGSTADTIIEQADQLDVDAIVVGSRGLTGMALLLGSVSLAVVQRANRTVVVVPSADVVTQRERQLDH